MTITYRKPNWYVDGKPAAATIPDMHRHMLKLGIDKRTASTACAMAKRYGRPIEVKQ